MPRAVQVLDCQPQQRSKMPDSSAGDSPRSQPAKPVHVRAGYTPRSLLFSSNNGENKDDPEIKRERELKKLLELSTSIGEELRSIYDWHAIDRIKHSKTNLHFSPLIECMKVVNGVLPHLINKRTCYDDTGSSISSKKC